MIDSIEIQEFEHDSGYYARGHHDPAVFAAAVDTYLLELCGDKAPQSVPPGRCHHAWYRFVPWSGSIEKTHMWLATAGSRGAFPITVFRP